MVDFAHKRTVVNRTLAHPGLVPVCPLLHLKVEMYIIGWIKNICVDVQNSLVATYRTQPAQIEVNASCVFGIANGIRELNSASHLQLDRVIPNCANANRDLIVEYLNSSYEEHGKK